MDIGSIGKNIRKYRMAQKLSQEKLEEKAGLSTNYIGSLERGEKICSLEAFIDIANALGVSSDMLLGGMIDKGQIEIPSLCDRLGALSAENRAMVYDVAEAMLRHMK